MVMYGHPQPPMTPPDPPPRSRNTGALVADIIVGAVLWAILLLGGGLAMFVSVMFFSAGVDC